MSISTSPTQNPGTVTSAPPAASSVARHATGTFTPRLAPVEASDPGKAAGVGRMSIDKTFTGGIEGTSQGEMLMNSTESTKAMAYVALERVTGSVDGHHGTFVLMHNATMRQGDASSSVLHVTVVPGSGTGELAGLTGTFDINIDATGKHSYNFAYTLP